MDEEVYKIISEDDLYARTGIQKAIDVYKRQGCRYCDRASGAEHAWSFNSGTELIYRS